MRRSVSLISLLFAALPLGAIAQSASPVGPADPAAWCVEKGGTVVHRTPLWAPTILIRCWYWMAARISAVRRWTSG
jgi:hypothetical protein